MNEDHSVLKQIQILRVLVAGLLHGKGSALKKRNDLLDIMARFNGKYLARPFFVSLRFLEDIGLERRTIQQLNLHPARNACKTGSTPNYPITSYT